MHWGDRIRRNYLLYGLGFIIAYFVVMSLTPDPEEVIETQCDNETCYFKLRNGEIKTLPKEFTPLDEEGDPITDRIVWP